MKMTHFRRSFATSLLNHATILVIFTIFISIQAFADSIKHDGIFVEIESTPETVLSTESVQVGGVLKRLDFDDGKIKPVKKADLNQVEIQTYFPDFTNEVTSATVFQNQRSTFSYTAHPFQPGLSHQFITVIGKVGPECKGLTQVRSKFSQRLVLVSQKLVELRALGVDEKQLKSLIVLEGVLKSAISKIDRHINDRYRNLTIVEYPIQFKNERNVNGSQQVVSEDFRINIKASPGLVFQGLNAAIQTEVEFVGAAWKENKTKYYHEAEYYWNGTKVGDKTQQDFTANPSLVFDYLAQKVQNNSEFLVKVYRFKEQKNGKWQKRELAAFLPYQVRAISDSAKPQFDRILSTPSLTQTYVRDPETIDLRVVDPFGRLDISTLRIGVDQGSVQELSSTSNIVLSLDGAAARITANWPEMQEGAVPFTAEIADKAGNHSDPYLVNFFIDRTKPSITLGVTDGLYTNQSAMILPIQVLDASPTSTFVRLNGVEVYQSNDLVSSPVLQLSTGQNQIEVVALDAAGNQTISQLHHIVLDQTPPVIDAIEPEDGELIRNLTFVAKAQTNEALSFLKLNQMEVPLSASKTGGEINYNVPADGQYSLKWCAIDLAGNISHKTIQITVSQKVLKPELVTVAPMPDEPTRLMVMGSMGAALPGTRIKVSFGFFNSFEAIANEKGEFQIETGLFNQAKIEGFENPGSRYESYDLFYQIQTRLSGVIKDNQGRALPHAKVSMSDPSVQPVFSNASGLFVFENSSSGDQTLTIDGSTIEEPCSDCSPRTFGVTSVKVTIGLNQANVLQNPIFLNPNYLDGTNIEPASGGSVISARAPGVELEIQPNSIVGGQEVKISLETVPAEFSTIQPPQFAKPAVVTALEPSGLKFSKPVQVTLPNVDELPEGTNVIIMSFDSSKGTWGPDGVGVVNADGSTITTKPNQGIRHFSSIYAVPAGMKVTQLGAQDKPGANTFDGALSTSLQLPSYTSLGTSRSVGLTYKSSWARPNVVVTNIFDIPRDEINRSQTEQGGIFGYALANATISARAWVEPEYIKATFSTGGLNSGELTFTGVPNRAAISFGFGLESFQSGHYPYASHWEIKLKQTVVQTIVKRSRKFFLFGPLTADGSPQVETAYYYHLFPQDFGGSLIVQNKTQSESGAGWKINSTQRILDPSSNKIVIEEADGAVSTYDVDHTISTVKIFESGLLATEGGRIQWPYAYVGRVNANHRDVVRYNLANSASAGENVGLTWGTSGYFVHNWRHTFRCGAFGLSTCQTPRRYIFPYTTTAQMSDAIQSSTGEVFVADTRMHAILRGQPGTTLNRYLNPELSYPFATDGGSSNPSPYIPYIQGFCASQGFSCPAQGHFDGFAAPAGSYASAGTGGDTQSTSKLNSPRGLALHPSQPRLMVADTGNHRVVSVDLSSGQVSVYAGNGSLFAKQDQVPATQSSLISPVALSFDSTGGLFILTSEGYIRYVGTNGLIKTIGGLPHTHPDANLSNRAPSVLTSLYNPSGLVLDEENAKLYVSDTGHNRVVAFDVAEDGVFAETIAGTGTTGVLGDGGAALAAQLNQPTALGLDADKNLLILDSGNNRIRRVTFSNLANSTLAFKPTSQDHSKLIKLAAGFVRTYRDGTVVEFDLSGKETSRRDRVGRTITSQYDADGRLISQADPVGLTTQYSYSGVGSGAKLSEVRDPAGRVTKFYYQANFLREVVFPDHTSVKYEYNDQGLLAREISPSNKATHYVYNQWNRLEKIIKADGSEIIVNDSTSATMANNFTGGSNGVLKPVSSGEFKERITDGNQVSIEIKKDESGFISKIKDANGIVTKIDRNLRGQPLVIYKNFTENNPDTVLDDQFESKVEMTYNDFGDLIKTVDYATGLVEERTYNNFGDVISEKSKTGAITTHSIHPTLGLKQSVSNSLLGLLASYSYSGALQLLQSESLPNGAMTSYQYDAFGNVSSTTKKITAQVSASSSVVRDAAGNVTESADAKGQITKYEYDTWNRLIAVITPKGERTEYLYTLTGKLSQVKDPVGGITQYEYNAVDQVIKKTDSLGKVYQYAYDGNGNLVLETDPNGNAKSYVYDRSNRLVKKQLPDNVISFTYNKEGQATSISTKNTGIQITYDATGKLPRFIRTFGTQNLSSMPDVTLEYRYDSLERLVKILMPEGETQYAYDALNRLTNVQHPGGEFQSYSYDQVGRLNQIERNGGLRSSLSFDLRNGLTRLEHRSSSALLSYFDYTRDLNGFTNQIATSHINRSIAYDTNSQVTGVTSNEIGSESYAYDSMYNRTADAGGSYEYDAKKQRLTEDYRHFYFYDENGNLISKQKKGLTGEVTQYTYNSENQLLSIKRFDAGSSTPSLEAYYEYDGLGHRVMKRVVDGVNGSNSMQRYYVYHQDEVITEYNNNGDVLVSYHHSGLRTDDVMGAVVTESGVEAGIAPTAGTYRFIKDALGSITEILDSTNTLKEHIVYSSFGVPLQVLDSNRSPASSAQYKFIYGYTGREIDRESGLYYYRARYYDPTIGRFLQKDPHPGSIENPATTINSYIYTLNNSLAFTDPSGRLAFLLPVLSFIVDLAITSVVAGAASGVFQGLLAGLISSAKGGSFGTAFIEGFANGFVGGALLGGLAFTGGFVGALLGLQQGAIYTGLAIGAFQGAQEGKRGGILAGILGFTSGFVGGTIGAVGGVTAANTISKGIDLSANAVLGRLGGDLISPQVPLLSDIIGAQSSAATLGNFSCTKINTNCAYY